MYTREKQSKQASKVYYNMPSFSSTLLDEVYRSLDGNVDKTEHSYKQKPAKNMSSRKASLVEKWMEKEVIEKVTTRDNDVLLFSSTCSSSDSSGQLSSSDDFFGSQKEYKVSGLQMRPKPVRTGKQGLFDDYQTHQKVANDDNLTKSKSKALKIYSHLKKMKQPISPGVRLTNFINTLFSNSSGKKAKNVENCKGFKDTKSSSACSFSRSCLNKYSSKSREKTVKFHPVSVIIDEDSSRTKCTNYNDDMEKYGKPPLPPYALSEFKQNMMEKNRRIEEAVQKVLEGYNRHSKDEEVTRKVLQGYTRQKKDNSSMFRKKCDESEEDEYDDVMSDSSSDLFELDHLASFRDNKFAEELPVYETTQLDSSRAMFRGLIR